MSRFYALELYAPNATGGTTQTTFPGQVSTTIPPKTSNGKKLTYNSFPSKVWTSHPNGTYDPGAQNILFDILIYSLGLGAGPSFLVVIEGVSFEDIKQHNNFHDYGIRLYAGMMPGLPLANGQPTPGLIAQGYVEQGIGNWVGEDMTMSLVCKWGIFSPDDPGNIVFQWKPGQTLAQALQACLSVAFPGFPIVIKISDQLTTTHTVTHMASTLANLSLWLHQYTRNSLGPKYDGVDIVQDAGGIRVYDGTVKPPPPTQLKFTDLIGQPTWTGGSNDANLMDVMTVLRSDLSAGNKIEMPVIDQSLPGLVFETPSYNNAAQNYETSFKGDFIVHNTRQIGNFRGESADDWSTLIRCNALVGGTPIGQ